MLESNRTMKRLADANVKQDADTKAMATQLATIQQALAALAAKIESSSSSSNDGNDATQPSDPADRFAEGEKGK